MPFTALGLGAKITHALKDKGYVEHRKHGREFVYRPTRPRGDTAG